VHERHPHVLLIEDNPSDRRLTEEAFREVDPSVIVDVVSNGVEAMTFLRREGSHAEPVRPAFILLALSGLEGRDILALIKSDAGLKSIPTVILSASDVISDVVKCYELQANWYIRKPEQFDGFERLIRSLSGFWLTTVKFPSQG
jgi:chemotaxis family two-component system response regulator Rcp1